MQSIEILIVIVLISALRGTMRQNRLDSKRQYAL